MKLFAAFSTVIILLGLGACAGDLEDPPIDQEEQLGPTDGDTGSGHTTTTGSASQYPGDKLYDPSYSLLGTSCITWDVRAGKMTGYPSYCSTYPATCGMLYCMAHGDTAEIYYLNRAWNPDNSLLGNTCIQMTGNKGTMESRCATTPSTCGYLYCLKIP